MTGKLDERKSIRENEATNSLMLERKSDKRVSFYSLKNIRKETLFQIFICFMRLSFGLLLS